MKNDTNSNITATLECILPDTAVNDTTSAIATVFGDMLGDMLSNLLNLIQMSYGCGEQNMLNFVPNIVALIYLDNTNQLTPAIRAKAVAYAIDGYIRQLNYRRTDGSFSAFGNDDPVGSTWLTAYVIKSFYMAKPYIFTDQNVINAGIDFVMSKQNADGSYREDGIVFHKDMQGGSGTGIGMTAYIVIVITENLAFLTDPKYEVARNKSCDYIAANINENNVYDLSITTYALFLANHIDLERVAEALWEKRIETGDMIHWEKPDNNAQQNQNAWWYHSQPLSVNIEITAYALLYYANIDLAIAAKIAKWLVSQKNQFGGYGSSQDTVVGIAALADFSIKFRQTVGTLDIHLAPNLGNPFDVEVNPDNLFTVQSFKLEPLTRQLNVSTGVGSRGTAIVSLTCNFYVLENQEAPRFIIKHEFVRPCNNKLLRLRISLTYIAIGDDIESNMVLMQTRLPSGYIYDSDFPLDKVIRVRFKHLLDEAFAISFIFIYRN